MSVLPRIVHGAYPVPAEWLTPPGPTGMQYRPDEVRAYVNGRLVEWAEIIHLDARIDVEGKPVMPYVEAMYPDGGPVEDWRGGKWVATQPRRPVTIFGQVEVRKQPDPATLERELAEVYAEEYGWVWTPQGWRPRA